MNIPSKPNNTSSVVDKGNDQYTKQTSYGTAKTSSTSGSSFLSVDNDGPPAKDLEYSNNASTAALCLCMLTHSYLLISVFPYAGFMAIELVPNANEETAGSYAGLIASMFMIGRCLSAYSWGKLADTYGRKFCLCAALVSSCTFTLLFGLAPTFGMALFWRFCLGLGNGIVGTTKTAVTELARGNEKLETQAMGWVIAMWGFGFLIGPAISGFLAEPVSQYAEFWSQSQCMDDAVCGWMRQMLLRYPFLLPNVAGALVCLCSLATVIAFVEETLPSEQRRPVRCIPQDLVQALMAPFRSKPSSAEASDETTPLSSGAPLNSTSNVDRGENVPKEEATIASIWARPSTRQHLVLYWGASLLSIVVDEAFPLLCISQQAGLGISEVEIGKILSLSGLLFVVFQYPVYACLVRRWGVHGSVKWGLFPMMPLLFFIPGAIPLNRTGSTVNASPLSWAAMIYAGTLLALYRIFGLVFFSNMTIATNRTVPAHQRATMNGLSMLGGSAMKAAGPLMAGCLFAFSVSSGVFSPPQLGASVPFCVFGAAGLGMACYGLTISKSKDPLDPNEEEGVINV